MQACDVLSLREAVSDAARTAVAEAFAAMRAADLQSELLRQPSQRSLSSMKTNRTAATGRQTPMGRFGCGSARGWTSEDTSPSASAFSASAPRGTPNHEWLCRHIKPHNASMSEAQGQSATSRLQHQAMANAESPSVEKPPVLLGDVHTTVGKQHEMKQAALLHPKLLLSSTAVSHLDLESSSVPVCREMEIVSGITRLRRLYLLFLSRLTPIVNSIYFDFGACLLVFCHAVLVGIHTDVLARQGSSRSPTPVFDTFDTLFCIVFVFELLLRLGVNGMYFFQMAGWQWNVFDCCVITSQALEEITKASAETQFSFLRTVRILRLLRAIRIVRVMRLGWMATRELRSMVTSIMSSFKYLCWTIVLLGFIIYIVSIYFTHVVSDHLAADYACVDEALQGDCEQLRRYFGTFGRTALTLFQSITGGVDWDDVISPLSSQVSPMLGFVFFVYIVSAVLAFLNVTTGVFVEASIKSAKADRDFFMINNVRQLFKDQTSGNGEMTWDNFVGLLNAPEMQAYFKAIDLDPSEARGLFRLLDLDDSGTVDAEEFLNGCLRLRGPAKALDLALVMHAMRRMHNQIDANLCSVLYPDTQPVLDSVTSALNQMVDMCSPLQTSDPKDQAPASTKADLQVRMATPEGCDGKVHVGSVADVIESGEKNIDLGSPSRISSDSKLYYVRSRRPSIGQKSADGDMVMTHHNSEGRVRFGSVADIFEMGQCTSSTKSSDLSGGQRPGSGQP